MTNSLRDVPHNVRTQDRYDKISKFGYYFEQFGSCVLAEKIK